MVVSPSERFHTLSAGNFLIRRNESTRWIIQRALLVLVPVRTHVEKLFPEVVDVSVETRKRYFDEHRIATATRRELEELIAFDSWSSTCLVRNIGQVAELALAGVEPRGIRCGPYQLRSLIGRGGMGTVHLAERVDGEVTQQVAVKLLRPGADDPLLRERFLAERQILASLTHPNIARLLDAGHTDDGQPYLVMEYVEGKALDVYTFGLATAQKIRLFLKVCAAVSYLHRNLVVHRDLKPSNILVTQEGEPKLLDFGIAKMLDLTTDSTATDMRMMTPDYASPEQVTGCPVSTASDVYSLGAVLYKVLTGSPPRQFEGNSAASIALAIVSGNVTPPSKLLPSLKGDLEFILMKALRREPQERYATVEQLSDDLQNYLSSLPINARKGDTWYQTRKFFRNYWLPSLATALVTASLSTGLVIANRERVIAERRFGQLRQLSGRVIDLDTSIRTLPGSVDARQRLVSASLEYLEGLSQEARGNLDMTEEIADGYWRMARIQGVNAEFNLGDPAKAEDNLKKADRLMGTVLAGRPDDRAALFRSAVIVNDRMILADSDQRRSDTLLLAQQAVSRIETFLAHDDQRNPIKLEGFLRAGDPAQAERAGIAGLYVNVAMAYVNIHMYPDGARYAHRAVEVAEPIPGAQDLASQAMSLLANALRYQGDLEAAFTTIGQARQTAKNASYPSETTSFFSQYDVALREGRILGEADAINLDRPNEAIEVLQKALNLANEAAGKDPRDSASRTRVATAARELGKILRDHDPQRALAIFDVGIQRLGETGNDTHARRERALLMAHSSYSLRRLHRLAEAKARIDDSFAILRATDAYPTDRVRLASHVYYASCALADYETEAGNTRRAVEIYEELLEKVMATHPDPFGDLRDTPKLSRIYESLSFLYGLTGSAEKASAMKSKRMDLWRHWQHELPHNAFVHRQVEAARLH